MSEASFASLGPTLLARKGGAKPAMRPQWGEMPETVAEDQLEDLGWNDMGADDDVQAGEIAAPAAVPAPDADGSANMRSAEVVSINPSAGRIANTETKQLAADDLAAKNDAPEKHLVKAKPSAKKSAAKAQKSKKKTAKRAASSPSSFAAPASQRRAAFTLRLDADRHLKLRLAATMNGVSAQALVTEALDIMLAEIDDLDALARRMKRH